LNDMIKQDEASSFCTWCDDYRVKVHKMDEQHRGLFATVNGLYRLLLGHGDMDRIDRTFSELIRQTIMHFKTEEEFMCTCEYPDYRHHKEMHDELLSQVENLQAAERELRSRNIRQQWEERLETADFLSAWLVEHIVNEDKKLGAFLNGRGFGCPGVAAGNQTGDKSPLSRMNKR